MRKAKSYAFLLTLILALALLIMPFGALSVSAAESTDTQVTATTSASVKQGNSGYCYVYIDSLESVSTLSVSVHYDSNKIKVQGDAVYNTVSSLLNDKSVSESSVQFSYIFDGKGKAEKTQLFYFRYTVLSDADLGDTYFDIVVNEAYDSSLQPVSVSGSRCAFTITETVTTKTCSIYSSSSVSTSVGEEFEISYRLSTYQIASGSFTVSYDPELFEVVGVTNGAFCDNKIVDVNTKLAGSVYVSFVGTEYKSNTNLITVKFKTLKNVAEKSTIKMTVTEFYNLALNPISCSGYTTTANIAFDETYTEDAPSMTLQTAYNAQADKVTLTVKLDRDSMLGAGDFVLKFNTNYLTYNSAEKGFSPTFFNINDKNVSDGILKFSIISLSNITDEQIVLAVTFDVKHACEDKLVDFEISGSGLTDALTNTIVLNFVDASVSIPLEHTAATATTENRVEPTCTADGRYDSVIYCAVCDTELSRETKTVDKLGHDHSTEWTVDIKPTCTTTGSKSHHCSRCDHQADITIIPANGHSFGEWYVVKAPTCTATGIDEHKCSVCHTKETREIAANGHIDSIPTIENRVDPDCTNDGSYDSVVYCSVCTEELSRESKLIDQLGHNEILHIGKVATCTDGGYKDYVTCSRCNYSTYETIPALGHAEVSYSAKAPTCTEIGWEAYFICSACGYTTYKELTALGHTYSEWIIDEEATFEVDGKKHKECTVCQEILEESIIPMLQHSYTSVITAPTCTEQGYTTHTCSDCGNSYVDDYVPAKGHTFGAWTQDKAPTCTAEGVERKNCIVCDDFETRSVAPLGHSNSQPVIENKIDATCTDAGRYDSVVYCSVCDVEISRESKVIAALGHNYDVEWTVDIAPTCTEKGRMSHHCTRCDLKTDLTEVPANGHTNATAVVENKVNATCTSNGSYDSVIYCSICGDELSRETKTINKINHSYSDWLTSIEAACTVGGRERRDCYNCEHFETRNTSALGHNHVEHEAKAETCTEIGWDAYISCSRCDYSTYVEIPSKGGHVFGEWVQAVAPGNETKGEERRDCENCDHYETKDIAALGYLQAFIDAVANLSKNQFAEITYNELYAALQLYAKLTDEEKQEANDSFLVLQAAIESYNAKANVANKEMEKATEIAFIPISASFTFLAALWFLLKKKFWIK